MSVWVGSDVGIRIARKETGAMYAVLEQGGVDFSLKRFSVDKPVHHYFITGDKIEITRVDSQGKPSAEVLDFIQAEGWGTGERYPDGTWYCNVNPVGGIRLFNSWSEALANDVDKAIALESPSSNYRLRMQVVQSDQRCLARTQSWTLNTNRDVADITSLGDGFQKNMGTMVSGSGELDCLFDVYPELCGGDDGTEETSMYLHKLALRLEIGATFNGVYLLKKQDCNPLFNQNDRITERELFYACDCVVTEVGVEVNTEDVIHSQIQFVTTGTIELLHTDPLEYLLQEEPIDEDKILQETDFGILV